MPKSSQNHQDLEAENATLQLKLEALRSLLATGLDAADLRGEQHLDFPEHFQRIAQMCASMRETLDLDLALRKVAADLLEVFDCDRAWMLAPCSTESSTWQVPIERCREEWPSCLAPDAEQSMSAGFPRIIGRTLDSDEPIAMNREECLAIEPNLVKLHGVQSQILVRMQPQLGSAWLLGLHQCSHDRDWSERDRELFAGVAKQISAVLGNLLVHRDLEQREQRMQLALESVEDGVWDWDIRTGKIIVSHSWSAMLGYESHEIAPHLDSWKLRVHPDDLPEVMDILEQHLDGKTERYSAEYRMQTKTGTWLWVLDRGRVVERDSEGGALRMTGTNKSIQAEKHAEELLLRERRLFTGGPCVVFRWVATEGWPVEYVSPNVLGFLGHSAEDFMSGRVPYSTVVHPDDLERVAAEVSAHSESGAPNFEQEYRVVRPSGEVRWLYDFTVINRDSEGVITHFEGYVLDATERKQAEADHLALEAQVQHAQKLESLGILAGGIAHDFNNLLMGVLGHADLAMSALPVTSPAVQNIRGIMDAAKQAAELTHQMLAYSGKGRFLVESLDINQVIEEMTRLLDVTLSKAAILRFDLAPNLPPVEADGSQLRQVIMNLITNAAEAIGSRSGIVSVNTGAMFCDRGYLDTAFLNRDLPEGAYVWFEVADTGEGMDTATLERIFDPFFTTKFTGRGLGLAAVQGIIRGHSGAIRVYSEPGRGTTFKVLLPASGQPLSLAPKDEELAEWHSSGTILLVDDEETVRAISTLTLEALGFDVLVACDGPEALELFRAQPERIDCVLLDLTMPQMNGDEVFRELRRLRADVRVILSSGYNQADIVQRFAGKGLAAFIQKPYGREALAKLLRQVLTKTPPESTPDSN